MKPAAFEYYQPETITEALELLVHYQGNAKIIAGGQSLAPMMNMRMAHMQAIIDVNGLTELANIQDHEESLIIGALTRHEVVASNALIRSKCPLLAYAANTIGHYVIRQRGTIGGSLCHADPAAQMPLIAMTLGTKFNIKSKNQERTILAKDFYLGAMTSSLAEDEMVCSISYPHISPTTSWAFEIFNRRHGDYAIVSVALCVDYDSNQCVQNIRIGLNGTSDFAKDYSQECQSYLNQSFSLPWLNALTDHLISKFTPFDDKQISATYRLELAKKLIQNAFLRTFQNFSSTGH